MEERKSGRKTDFKALLEEKLTRLDTPQSVLACKDIKCRDINHKQDLDKFTLDLLESVQKAAEVSLPIPCTNSSNGKDKKDTPGWKDMVRCDSVAVAGTRSNKILELSLIADLAVPEQDA